jgi:hypothetical protein
LSSKFDSDVDSLWGESEFVAFYIVEANVNSCPRIDVTFGDEAVGSVVNTRTGISVIAGSLYDNLVTKWVPRYEITIINAVLITALLIGQRD